jgi:hypothetical protein
VGTFQQTGLPANVHYQAPVNLTYTVANIVEQGNTISADSGSGGTGTIYKESFTWTAPVAGTGTVSFWGALNAVDNNGTNDAGDKWNTQTLIVTEDTATVVNSINELNGNLQLNIYPNPSADLIQLEMNNAAAGKYSLSVFDAEGRIVSNQIIEVTGNFSKTAINSTNWSAGIYYVSLLKDGVEKVVRVVKR